MRTYTLDIFGKSMNSTLWIYLAEKMHRISDKLKSHDFRIVFSRHLTFLVLAYIPTPKKAGALRSIWVIHKKSKTRPPRPLVCRRLALSIPCLPVLAGDRSLELAMGQAG
jgi:hypothetical protein